MLSIEEFLVILVYTSFANEWEGLENEKAVLHQCVRLRYTQRYPQRTRIVCVILLPCREAVIVLLPDFI